MSASLTFVISPLSILKKTLYIKKCKDFSFVELAFLLRFAVISLACADEMPRCTCTITAWLLRQMLCVAGQGMVAADNCGR